METLRTQALACVSTHEFVVFAIVLLCTVTITERFAEHQVKTTYGLGYKLTLTRDKHDAVLNKADAIADATNRIDNVHCFVPYFTPSIPQQGMLSKQILCETPKELRYIYRSVIERGK